MPSAASPAQCTVFLALCFVAAQLPARCQVLVRIRATGPVVSSIVVVGDEVWLGGYLGAFRVDRKANQAVGFGGPSSVNSIVAVGDEVWLGGEQGAFRVDRKAKRAVRVEGDVGRVGSIVVIGDEIWLGGEEGAFRVNRKDNWAEPFESEGLDPTETEPIGRVYSIVAVGDEIWLGSEEGAFRVDRKADRALPLGGSVSGVYSIVAVGDEVWLGTADGAFRVDRKANRAVRLEGDTGHVFSIVAVDDEIWLGSEKGAFRVDRKANRAMRLEGDTGSVSSIVAVGDEIWLGTKKGAFRVSRKAKQGVPLGGVTSGVSSILSVGDEVWFVSSEEGAFCVDRKANHAVPLEGDIGHVYSIVPVGDEVWLGGAGGAFRVDRRTKISVDFDRTLPGIARLWGKIVWFEGITRPIVRYVDTQTGKERYDSSQAAPIALVYDSDPERLRVKEEERSNWIVITPDSPLIELKPGWRRIYFSVRDGQGNEVRALPVEGWVIPTWTLSVLIPVLSTTFLLVCLVLSPYVRYCHMLLMNPFLRNWASFGVVPLLVTAVSPLRRHMLRRYCRTLAREERLRASADRYVVPDERFTSSGFAKILAAHKVIGLHGQSGVGKSAFLTYLAYQCASRKSPHPLLRSLVPVLLDLSVAGEVKPEQMVRTAMRKYGDLTDEKLTEVLLDYGGFLFLCDGLNAVSKSSSDAILQFADMHREHSCSCLTTQVATEGLKKISTLVAGSPLANDKIKELVRRVAIDPTTQQQKFDPASLLEKFSVETYKICRVPLQLELAVEMWEASGRLPENLDELYSYVLGPLVDKEAWSDQGHGEWPDVLNALAFTMMTGKRPYDPKKDYLPEELKVELLAKKLLVERGEVLDFRHDRIRAYLAARYFARRWRTILTDEKTIVDPNWDAMLEFHLAVEQSTDRARDLVLLVLRKDMDAAIRASAWGQQNRPELFKGWQADFEIEVGKRVVGGSGKPLSAVSDP